jgi:hypothetical protein
MLLRDIFSTFHDRCSLSFFAKNCNVIDATAAGLLACRHHPLSSPAVGSDPMLSDVCQPPTGAAIYYWGIRPRVGADSPEDRSARLAQRSAQTAQVFIFPHISRYSPIGFFKLPLPGQPACCMLGTISVSSSSNIYQNDLRVASRSCRRVPIRRTV